MVICTDTSFLFSLYGNDANSLLAIDWVAQNNLALTLSLLNDFELGNALRCAVFRKMIPAKQAAIYWSHYEADQAEGRLCRQVCNLAAVVQEAGRLSQAYSQKGGHRGFDILQVAAALHLKADQFLTFDANQKKLAEVVGLSVPIQVARKK